MIFVDTDSERRVTINNIFPYAAHKSLGNISQAFSQAEGSNYNNGYIKTQYITFNNVFSGQKFGSYSDPSLCSYVFAYYSSDTVEFKNKSLPTEDVFKNYVTT